MSHNPDEPIDRVEHAFQLIIKHEHLYKKLGDVRRCSRDELLQKIHSSVDNKLLTAEERDLLIALEAARWDAILVDEFTFDSMQNKIFSSVTQK